MLSPTHAHCKLKNTYFWNIITLKLVLLPNSSKSQQTDPLSLPFYSIHAQTQ